ncbi:putative hydrolase MutT/NUDIX [Pseudonocardia sulfidoxydans NBRC 16205]|uniref:Putative hydrolase MutT/NUDIX n=1 Tax=Pseudonocardia sulfidoxydans NBRC 16205 TaxID=1223511 RepID=A0A511DL78_9PSEU|nr:NUDIX hydrolase [Pseudonocardia sulfidoxydans]GEL24544.1 putative hydrolase MutT/NUDIX [Pseudonocardia sulfidoxydans NBRC 16205]
MTHGDLARTLGVDVLAAGAVLWRAGTTGPEVGLVHRPRYDDWSLPKGKLDRGEHLATAAVREVVEETGHHIRIGRRLGDTRYDVEDGAKLVRYWAGESLGGAFEPNDETDELRFLTPADACGLLTYAHDRTVLRRFAAHPPPVSTLVLVRHAKAGSRDGWNGDDVARPLSATGRAQVARLTPFLRLFGADRIASAPPVRCRATVSDLAAAAGLPVTDEPALGEITRADDPTAATARTREIVAQPGVTVLCSQGGVIPDVVDALTAGTPLADRVRPGGAAIPARKASTWVIGFGADLTPRFADYYREPAG